MNLFKTQLALIIFSLITITGFSQELSEKQKEKDSKEVKIYTAEERDNLQRYYHEEVKKMKLTESQEESYYNVLLFHVYDMNRLDDKDKGYTEEEIRDKLDVILGKLNSEMKTLLSSEQYVMHLELFNKIVYNALRKKGLD